MWLCVSTGNRKFDKTDFSIKNKSNFGDELNFYIFPRLIGEHLRGWVLKQNHHLLTSEEYKEELIFGIGSILQDLVSSKSKKIIFGAGYGWGLAPDILQNWEILFPRGPLTGYALGKNINAEYSCDAAYLLKLIPEWDKFTENTEKKRTIVIPHHGNKLFKKYFNCRNIEFIDVGDIRFISPTANIEWIINQIIGSNIVYAEAMHAAIVADLLRCPWQPIVIGEPVCEFKWHDWAASMEMIYRPVVVVRSWRKVSTRMKVELIVRPHNCIEKIANELSNNPHTGQLSNESVLERRLSFLSERVDALKNISNSK